MITRLFTRLISILSALAIANACVSHEEMFLKESDVEMFLYDSPITSLTDAGNNLLLGTARGEIVSFSLDNGSFQSLHHDEQSRFIYQVVSLDDGTLLYSVRDGGINHLLGNGTIAVYELDTLKKASYSAYRVLYDNSNIYAATSNGVYCWDDPYDYGLRLDAQLQSDLRDPVSNRFYSIQPSEEHPGAFQCAGELGLSCLHEDGTSCVVDDVPLYAAHGNMSLSRDWKIYRDGKILSTLTIPALDFVDDGRYIYAVSMSAIEIVDLADGRNVATINLPERNSSYKNVSCRAFCLIKDDYLYVAPGGCTLYRMPVYKYASQSEEVIQVCASDDGSAYLLTSGSHLYSFDPQNSQIGYLRSLDDSKDIELIGGRNGNLLVTFDGVYYELSGRRFTDESHLSDLNHLNKSKVLWHLLDDDQLYQGQVDGIRIYDAQNAWSLVHEFDDVDYPKLATFCRDNLVLSTMHDGTFLLNEGRFEKISGMPDVLVKDVDGGNNVICALSDSAVTLKRFTRDNTSVSLLDNASYEHLTDLVVLNDRSFMVFSTYNMWCKGIVLFTEQDDATWQSARYLRTYVVNDAVKMEDSVLACGTMGLSLFSSDGTFSTYSVSAPTFFEMNILAWNYPWGIIIYLIALLILLVVLVWCGLLLRRYYLKYRKRKISEEFCSWVEAEYKGKYIRSMARQLIKSSGDCAGLQENISLFKSNKSQLDRLDKFVDDVVALYEIVKSLKAHDIEKDHREEIALLKERLEYFCRADHPFGGSIIKEWGKTTVQPVRTLMLLPLKFKIKYMQIFDSRTGTEKMDFKSFMDKNRSRISQRKLEIRDLIALSAYDAIVSENGIIDA